MITGPDDLPPDRIYAEDFEEEKESVFERLRRESMELREFNLTELNGKPINENKNAAWEIIEGAFCAVLQEDPKWHYFFEDSYSIIRCSYEFEDDLRAYLDDCGVKYSEPEAWVDGQPTTLRYQYIFCPMFHTFSMMSIVAKGCNYSELYVLFDRVAHCFLNHQYLSAYNVVEHMGANWEAQIVAQYAVNRAFCTANYATNALHREINKKKEKEKWWAEKCLAKVRKKLKRNPA